MGDVEITAAELWGTAIDVESDSSEAANTLERWFEVEHRALLRLAFLLTGDRSIAEDVVQEAFIRLHGAEADVEREGFRTYARRTLVNLTRSRFRRRARERRALIASLGDEKYESPDIGERDALWRAVLRLSPLQRACIALRFYEDMTATDIATTLGTSVGSVRQQMHKGMQKLRVLLEEGDRR